MRAAVFHGRQDVRIESVPDPVPGRGELLLRVHATGICGTDAHEYAHGPSMFPVDHPHPVTGHHGPLVPGHEIAGRIVAVGGDVDGFREGELVASGAAFSCGECAWCRRGRTNLCVRYAGVGLHRDGGLAEYCALPAASCHSAERHGLTDDTAALAQPMSIAVHAARRGRLGPDDDVVIVGAGGIGAFLTHVAVSTAARVTVLDLEEERLRLAERLGAHQVLRPEPDRPVGDLAAFTEGAPTVVFEVTGTAGGLATARELLAAGSRLVAVGLQSDVTELALRSFSLVEHELIGTNALVVGTDLPEALRLLSVRTDPWNDVAPVALPLAELVSDGLEPMAAGRATRVKTLIDPWAGSIRATRM